MFFNSHPTEHIPQEIKTQEIDRGLSNRVNIMSSSSSPSPQEREFLLEVQRGVRDGLKAEAWYETDDGFPFGRRPRPEWFLFINPMLHEQKSCLLDAYSPSLMSLEHRWALEPTRKALASWLKYSDNGFFHISGKPRSGKTHMIDYIALSEVAREHLQTWCKTKRLTQMKICFRRTGDRRETSCEWNLQGMLRVILWSLIRDKQESFFHGSTIPIRATSMKSLFVLYLDGLNHFKQGFSRMLDHLKQWVSARPLDVKICISSRGEAKFQDSLKSYPSIIMHEVSQADMLWYIRWVLLHEDEDYAARFVRNTSPMEREELEQHFLAKVNGSFFLLWSLIGRIRFKDIISRDAIKDFVDDWMQQYEQGTLDDVFDRQLLRESYQDDPPKLSRV
ncbi:hypothetical protein ASPACDRAFT_1859949 [Aspergillus aculeatus ATCC 16872]|uniref:NACHT domain-containing protein n=1 Tax=Aspergillus aculeatus (strain ATCC 16872 / CBS 172.66 / WB 5094) TaxID=690307 RepID=A0A1L9WHP6_ASPA1|nr:uncharacterized protein ASPACDRAFT_1859949 [Aspergillus aculeatus ATCC 16872]OJJ95714.1 hypothetical protein ASPACDRAFT_1859949 [Aspergillus aculeatus ATCC 16872]